jgi:hypothetical protein
MKFANATYLGQEIRGSAVEGLLFASGPRAPTQQPQ